MVKRKEKPEAVACTRCKVGVLPRTLTNHKMSAGCIAGWAELSFPRLRALLRANEKRLVGPPSWVKAVAGMNVLQQHIVMRRLEDRPELVDALASAYDLAPRAVVRAGRDAHASELAAKIVETEVEAAEREKHAGAMRAFRANVLKLRRVERLLVELRTERSRLKRWINDAAKSPEVVAATAWIRSRS